MAYDVFDCGDGAYCYFAEVTKNFDDSDKPAYFNEIQIRAIPTTTDYSPTEMKDQVGSEAGKMWIPYVSDLIGVDSRRQDSKIEGYGLRSLPEVGSIVLVLAMKSGHSSNYQHIALGNFWNKDIPIPGLGKLVYTPGNVDGGDKPESVNNLNLVDDAKADSIGNLAQTTYYRTKAGTSIFADDINNRYGMSWVVKDKDKKDDYKYIALDLAGENIDLKLSNFTLTANNVLVRAENKLTFANATEDGDEEGGDVIVGSKEGGDITAKKDVSISSGKELVFKAKKITANKPGDPGKADVKLEPGKPEVNLAKYNANWMKEGINDWYAFRSVVELHVLRAGMTAEDLNAKPIVISKDMKIFVPKDDKELGAQVENLTLSFELNENDYIAFDYKVGDASSVDFKIVSDEIVKDEGSDGAPDISCAALNGLDVHLDVHMKVKASGLVSSFSPMSVRGKIFTYKRVIKLEKTDLDKNRVVVRLHYLDPANPIKTDDDIGFNVSNPADETIEKRFLPNYATLELKVPDGSKWEDALKDPANSKRIQDAVTSGCPKTIYVDLVETYAAVPGAMAGERTVRLKGPNEWKNGDPGIIKFIYYPRRAGDAPLMANEPGELSFGLDYKDGDSKKFANFNFKKSGKGQNLNKIEDSADRLGKNFEFSLNDDHNGVYDIYVKYEVERYLPIIPLCRTITEKISAVKGGAPTLNLIKNRDYPVFESDLYCANRKDSEEGKDSTAFNNIWQLVPCSNNLDNYAKLLDAERSRVFGSAADEAYLYVIDAGYDDYKELGSFLTKSRSIYRENARADANARWDLKEYKRLMKMAEPKRIEELGDAGAFDRRYPYVIAEKYKYEYFELENNGSVKKKDIRIEDAPKDTKGEKTVSNKDEVYNRRGYGGTQEKREGVYSNFIRKKKDRAPEVNNGIMARSGIGLGDLPVYAPGRSSDDWKKEDDFDYYHLSYKTPYLSGWQTLPKDYGKDNGDDKCGTDGVYAVKLIEFSFPFVSNYWHSGEMDLYESGSYLGVSQRMQREHDMGVIHLRKSAAVIYNGGNDTVDLPDGVNGEDATIGCGKYAYGRLQAEDFRNDENGRLRFYHYMKAGYRPMSEAMGNDHIVTEKQYEMIRANTTEEELSNVRKVSAKIEAAKKRTYFGKRGVGAIGYGDAADRGQNKKDYVQKGDNINTEYVCLRRQYVMGYDIADAGYGIPFAVGDVAEMTVNGKVIPDEYVFTVNENGGEQNIDDRRARDNSMKFFGTRWMYDSYPPDKFLRENANDYVNELMTAGYSLGDAQKSYIIALRKWTSDHRISKVAVRKASFMDSKFTRVFTEGSIENGCEESLPAEFYGKPDGAGDGSPKRITGDKINSAGYDINSGIVSAFTDGFNKKKEAEYRCFPSDIFAGRDSDAIYSEMRYWIKANRVKGGDGDDKYAPYEWETCFEDAPKTGGELLKELEDSCLARFDSDTDKIFKTPQNGADDHLFPGIPSWAFDVPRYDTTLRPTDQGRRDANGMWYGTKPYRFRIGDINPVDPEFGNDEFGNDRGPIYKNWRWFVQQWVREVRSGRNYAQATERAEALYGDVGEPVNEDNLDNDAPENPAGANPAAENPAGANQNLEG